jgi:two-component system nitrogen regulation response regulator GlnG
LELQHDSEPMSGVEGGSGDMSEDWETPLRLWAKNFLNAGQSELHTEAEKIFEKALIEVAMKHSMNHRQKAAQLLGWGRNTLTRKTQALGLDE